MGLLPTDFKQTWRDTVDLLNAHVDEGGAGKTCRLIFEGGIEVSSDISNDVTGMKPQVAAGFGGRVHANTITGNQEVRNDEDEGLRTAELFKNIVVRTYAITKPDLLLSLGAGVDDKIWQMNGHSKYIPDILRCKQCIINIDMPEIQTVVRLFRPPQPYGLLDKYEFKCFWRQITAQ